jgi:hypothetical protein
MDRDNILKQILDIKRNRKITRPIDYSNLSDLELLSELAILKAELITSITK